MNIQWQDGTVVFGDLDEFLKELLRGLPACANLESEAAHKRLYGSPTAGADQEADEEWREVVEPELQEQFQSHIDVVSEDLAGIQENEGTFTLSVPGDHLQAWVHTLNQARLALGAKYEITEDDMEGRRTFDNQDKGFALLQIEIYGLILGFLLRHTEL